MSVSSRRSIDLERGASAVLVAASLLALMGFAAVAVDLSSAKNSRRQDQSAADVGSLAAVQFAVPVTAGPCAGYSGATQARCAGALEAIAVANATLDEPGKANWSVGSGECSSPPAGYTLAPNSDCVAFNGNLEKAWVQIPTIEAETYFAKVLGFMQVATSAEAIASTTDIVSGHVLPWLVPGNAAGASYNCLKTAGNPKFGVCDDLPAVGNFGSMDFFLYGNSALGSTTKCTGDTNGRLVSNIARGIDHPLGTHPTGVGAGREEDTWCPVFSTQPDMVTGQPGVGSGLEDGLIIGGSSYSTTGSYPGRLIDAGGQLIRNAKPSGTPPSIVVNATPLWTYLEPGILGPCDDSIVDTPTEMTACIAWAKSTGTVIFVDALASAQRFGFTPLVWEPDFLTPGAYYHIKGYLPIYIDTVMFDCLPTTCDIAYTPGVASVGSCPAGMSDYMTCGIPGSWNGSLDAVTGYTLSSSIVPAVAKSPYPGASNQRAFNLEE